jgi:hypothetical protein
MRGAVAARLGGSSGCTHPDLRELAPVWSYLIDSRVDHYSIISVYISGTGRDDACKRRPRYPQFIKLERKDKKELSVAHNRKCAYSPRDPTTCRCECRGRDHGSAWRPGALDASDVRSVSSRQRTARRTLAFTVALTIAAGTVGGLTATGVFSSSSADSSGLAVNVNLDLKTSIAALSSLGFGGRQISVSGTSAREDCAARATGLVREFLAHHPCEYYEAQSWTITRQSSTGEVAFSWVEMPTVSLARQFKAEVDAYGTGNPPGISAAFNGRCYTSDRQSSTIWTVEVQPTGNVTADRRILQSAIGKDLPAIYLRRHCVT